MILSELIKKIWYLCMIILIKFIYLSKNIYHVWSTCGFLPIKCNHNLPILLMRTIFHQIYTLPGPQQKLPLRNGYIQRNTRQSTFNMPRHIIRTLIIMFIQILPLRCNLIKIIIQINPNRWITVLHKNKSCWCMHEKYVT